MFGDVERLSAMDTSLIGEGTPPEAFTDSRVAKIKGLDSQVITETLVTTLR
jgi:hypothetical protein